MHAHRAKVTVPESHEVLVRLPQDFPSGEAEITVVATQASAAPAGDMAAWLDCWIASLPPAPVVPLTALDRGDLYR
jgi:hypothetical protein